MITIPTISQLYNSIIADIQTEFGITIPTFGRSYLRAKALVQAAKLKLFYLAIGLLQKNIFPDTADPEASGGTLERWGRGKIGRNPYPATQGQYDIELTVTSAATIPAGTIFKSDDSSLSPGKLYILDAAASVTSPTDIITVRALEAGTGSKLADFDGITATAPIANVNSAAIVNTENVAPVAAEDVEDYRRVVLTSFRLYPQGGASSDYRIWGLEANAVKQIYPYAASGAANEVNVFVEATIASSSDGMGTPIANCLLEVADDIELDPITGKGRRPLAVFAVNVLPVVINQIRITIAGASSISAANRTLITAALTEAVNAVRPFIAGADTLAEKNDTFGVNNITNTILTAVPGSIFTSATMTIQVGAGSPAAQTTKTFDSGNVPYLTSVTYS